MFAHYRPGVQIGNDDCGCHSPIMNNPRPAGPAEVMKDELGNITRLQWTPEARFTLNLTSDTNIAVESGSKIFDVSGITPLGTKGWEGLLAYNTVDRLCWRYVGNSWKQLPELVSSPGSNVIITLSNENDITRVSIKNFRGESIFSDENKGSFIPLTVDDTLAKVLLQGFYHVDIYQISANKSKLIRRVPLSIGYFSPPKNPPIYNQGCHSDKASFATDNTLSLKNGVLSVNTSQAVQIGGILPISSGAVFEYAQPRNLIVNIDTTNKQASIGSHDIYNYIVSGGDVFCLLDSYYLEFDSGSPDMVKFKTLILEDNKIISHIVFINSDGSINYHELENQLDSVGDISELKTTLLTRMDELDSEHDIDIENMNDSITSISECVNKVKNQVGDLQVSDKIVELYNSYNNLNTSINQLDSEMDSKVSEGDVTVIVNKAVSTELSDDKLQEMINNAVYENMRLDGGVVED